jgi:alpha-glucosidase
MRPRGNVSGTSAGLPWWRSAVLYQVYPRSFADSNGDGIGDLAGVTGRLDHLVDLGVDALWLSPFYVSPMVDFGYDVADHCAVDPIFGTLGDFDALIAAAHARGLRVLVDYVPNHTSDRHPWFVRSRSSRDDPYRSWYVWADPGRDGGPPNNWLSAFSAAGPAWTLDQATGQYYLHSYTASQPDLNWHHPAVPEAMGAVLRFWLDRGVDGFRVDAVHRLIKDLTLADNAPEIAHLRTALAPGATRLRHIDQPAVHAVLRELHAVLAEYGPDKVLIGEVGVADPARWAAYFGAGDELDLLLNFAFWSQPWSAARFARTIEDTERVLPAGTWPLWALGNHDLPRLASRCGGAALTRLAAMLLLTLRGSVLLYYGDEIGMTDVPVPAELAVDPDGRDPGRTPMQWAEGANAGFCPPAATPWLPIPANLDRATVTGQQERDDSLLTLYRQLIALRRAEAALSVGSYTSWAAGPDVLAFRREQAGRAVLVALNFAEQPRNVELPGVAGGRLLLGTDPRRPVGAPVRGLVLTGYEGVVVDAGSGGPRP